MRPVTPPVKKPPPPRRAATPAESGAAVAFLVAALVLAGTLVQQRLARRPAPVSGVTLQGTMIVPTPDQEGVTVTPGTARLLSVDSSPDEADVLLGGVQRGETPFSTDFACEAGRPTVLEVVKAGYRHARFELQCVNGSTRVSVTLKKGKPGR